jgi:hypothetical protein
MEETAAEEEMILNGMSPLLDAVLMSRDTPGSQLLIQKSKSETGEIT